MVQPLSSALGVSPELLEEKGIFDTVLGVDTHLFVDPQLLKHVAIEEFRNSHAKIEKYFSDVIALLNLSTQRNDRAWREVYKRLVFKELHGVSIGYGVHSSDGSAIGPELASRLIDSASEILALGIRDPEVFLLLGLFEDDFGADRLSDMTISIIKDELYSFTQRMARELSVQNLMETQTPSGRYSIPKNPNKNEGLILLPKELLRDLPVALDRDGIDYVVAVNQELRNRLNQLIGITWKRRITKRQIKELIFSNKNNLELLLKAYKNNQASPYDFEKDPAGETLWFELGQKFAKNNPLSLSLESDATIDSLEEVVRKIVFQFKKNIEVNGLKENLYVEQNGIKKPLHERFGQRLFFSSADAYCAANDIDISPEPNSGNGPVDFKLSRGYSARVLVEIKLSSNPRLHHGYEKQLTAYEESEGTKRSIYVILRVTRSDSQIRRLQRYRDSLIRDGKTVPPIFVIDARLTFSASRR